MLLADPDDLAQALAFALRFQGKRPVRDAELAMARITAERLINHLRSCGFVVMKKPSAAPHSSGAMELKTR